MSNFKGKAATNIILILFVLVSVVISSFIGLKRHDIGANYRNVELILDYTESLTATTLAGMPMHEYLQKMKDAGIYSVSLEEDTLFDMQSRGEIILISSSEASKANFFYQESSNLNILAESIDTSVYGTFVVSLTEDAKEHLLETLPIRMEKYIDFKLEDFGDQAIAFIPMTELNTEAINVGFPRKRMEELESYGFYIVARPMNSPGITDSWINYIFNILDGHPSIKSIVFKGQEVLGYPSNIGKVADKVLESDDLCVADIEFTLQQGASQMARGVKNHLVRMHTITREELNKGMDMQTALERYMRAVREREIRMIYIRPLSPLNASTIESLDRDVDFVNKLYTNLNEANYTVSHTQIMDEISVSTFMMSMLVLGIAAAFMLALAMVLKINPAIKVGIPLISFLGYLVIVSKIPSLGSMGIKIVSLAASIVFPTLAITYALISGHKVIAKKDAKHIDILKKATLKFIVACAIALAGGLVMAASMTYTSYMLKVDQFNGVKLMHIVPIAFGLIVYWITYMKKEDESVWQSFLRLLKTPVLIWHVAVVGVIGVVGLILITRTGNATSSILPVTSLETQIRAFLERNLTIRPRSKEIFFGHPALVLLGGVIAKQDKFWVFPVSLAAMIGLVSMVNTFAHMHTPITVSIIRTLLGIGFGYLIGVLVLLVYSFLTNKKASKVG